jgi:WD40 repeat protein
MAKIYEFPAHDERVLCSALSPDGCTVVTGACDENLKVRCLDLTTHQKTLTCSMLHTVVLEDLGSQDRLQVQGIS